MEYSLKEEVWEMEGRTGRGEMEDAPLTWKQAANQFAILVGGRFINALN